MGCALGLDSVRFYAIDIDIRNLSDYIILKSQGIQGLASDMSWLYSFFNPHKIRDMKPEHFVILTRKGSLGLGEFPFPPWHKREKEDMLKAVGIRVEYGEEVELGESRGTYKTVGDQEHAEIIRLYVEEGLGMKAIAEKLGRSSRTPHEHIGSHNRAVERSGFCAACKRVGSQYCNRIAIREK